MMSKAEHYIVTKDYKPGDSFYLWIVRPDDLVLDELQPAPDKSPGIMVRVTPENREGHLAVVTRDQRERNAG